MGKFEDFKEDKYFINPVRFNQMAMPHSVYIIEFYKTSKTGSDAAEEMNDTFMKSATICDPETNEWKPAYPDYESKK